MNISLAEISDVPNLVELVNSGYRGEASKKGWTTEADLLDGNLRIDIPSLLDMINDPGAIILKADSAEGMITGCVYLQKQKRGLYLGLLTVSPMLQAGGIGRKLLTASELYAKNNNCSCIFMNVISRRHELIAWYERYGYQRTGETKPFPADERFGIPKESLDFIILEKAL